MNQPYDEIHAHYAPQKLTTTHTHHYSSIPHSTPTHDTAKQYRSLEPQPKPTPEQPDIINSI